MKQRWSKSFDWPIWTLWKSLERSHFTIEKSVKEEVGKVENEKRFLLELWRFWFIIVVDITIKQWRNNKYSFLGSIHVLFAEHCLLQCAYWPSVLAENHSQIDSLCSAIVQTFVHQNRLIKKSEEEKNKYVATYRIWFNTERQSVQPINKIYWLALIWNARDYPIFVN